MRKDSAVRLTGPLLVLGSELPVDNLSMNSSFNNAKGGGGIVGFLGLSINVNDKLEPLEETDESLMTPIAGNRHKISNNST